MINIIMRLILIALFASLVFAGNLKSQKVTHTLKIGVTIGEQAQGEFTLGLFGEVVPKTVENFRALCTGEKGIQFAGSPFHRIIPGFMI